MRSPARDSSAQIKLVATAASLLLLALIVGGNVASSAWDGGASRAVVGARAPVQGTPTPTPTATQTPPPPCGLYWRLVNSPNPGPYDISYGVAAISANDIWAVGFYQGGSGGL